jgi:EmrB/QacA subfamily drug resistance transporter
VLQKNEPKNNYSKKWLAFTGIALLSFGCYLDYTVVNVALPTIQQELRLNLSSLQWVMNIYFLALCMLATSMGRLGDLFGRRRCFYIGTSLFAIASIIAGCAPNASWLILGRLLQGVSAAIVIPLGPSLLPESFPEKNRARAIALLGSMGGMALALGPVLGGIIVTHWGWRFIFFINIPIVLLGYLFCFNSVKESTAKHKNAAFDWLGMILLGLAIGGIVLSLIEGQMLGWFHWLTLFYLVIGITACIALFKIENNHTNPLIDFEDFSNPLFYAGALLCFLAGTFSAVALFFDPLYLQIIRHLTPQVTGFVLFAIPVSVFGAAFLVEWLIACTSIIYAILIGIGLAILSATLHLFFTNITPLSFVMLTFILLGSMWALGNTVSIIAAQTAAGSHRSSAATGTMVTMFNMGGSIGLAISVVIYQLTSSHLLRTIFTNAYQQIDRHQFIYIENLISNPAQSLLSSMNTTTHQVFNDVFIHGFSGVMWFLVTLSAISFLGILIPTIHRHKSQ